MNIGRKEAEAITKVYSITNIKETLEWLKRKKKEKQEGWKPTQQEINPAWFPSLPKSSREDTTLNFNNKNIHKEERKTKQEINKARETRRKIHKLAAGRIVVPVEIHEEPDQEQLDQTETQDVEMEIGNNKDQESNEKSEINKTEGKKENLNRRDRNLEEINKKITDQTNKDKEIASERTLNFLTKMNKEIGGPISNKPTKISPAVPLRNITNIKISNNNTPPLIKKTYNNKNKAK